MRAAVVRALKQPLLSRTGPIPESSDGQILVKIVASVLCHTDMHVANGDWPVRPTPPFGPGHEGGALSSASAAASPL
jgi:propanol-preferring alcohol dehydrogenase